MDGWPWYLIIGAAVGGIIAGWRNTRRRR